MIVSRLKRFNDWIKGAKAKIDFMGLDNDRQKISLLPSWSGPDLLVFWEREVNIRFADVPAVIVDGVEQVPAAVAHTYAELIDLTRTEILCHVNRDRALIDLVHMRQKRTRCRSYTTWRRRQICASWRSGLSTAMTPFVLQIWPG